MEAAYETAWRPNPLRETSARVAFALSLLVHAALIVKIPIDIPDMSRLAKPVEPPLEVRIAPPPAAPPSPPQAAAPRVRPRLRPPSVAPAPPSRPAPAPPPASAAAPLPAPRSPAGDLSSYIASRQKERAALEGPVAKSSPAPAAEDADTRAKRIAAANLAAPTFLTFSSDPSRSGGVFHVTRMSRDYGEFEFYGWNIDMGRRTLQQIEVRRGDASDIRLAMVRKMIEIIRHYQPVEFTWESRHLGRSVTLSSLPRDNSGLEDFMMREMFE
jgi:hypothetical protein